MPTSVDGFPTKSIKSKHSYKNQNKHSDGRSNVMFCVYFLDVYLQEAVVDAQNETAATLGYREEDADTQGQFITFYFKL